MLSAARTNRYINRHCQPAYTGINRAVACFERMLSSTQLHKCTPIACAHACIPHQAFRLLSGPNNLHSLAGVLCDLDLRPTAMNGICSPHSSQSCCCTCRHVAPLLGMIRLATSMSTCCTQREYKALMVPFITLACLTCLIYSIMVSALLALHACLHARTSALVSLLHASCRCLAAVAKLRSHSAFSWHATGCTLCMLGQHAHAVHSECSSPVLSFVLDSCLSSTCCCYWQTNDVVVPRLLV